VAHLTVSMAPNFTTLPVAPQKYGMAAVENHCFIRHRVTAAVVTRIAVRKNRG
jgi:hypothetical protein